MQILLSSGFINQDLEVICAQSLLVSIEIIWKLCLVKNKQTKKKTQKKNLELLKE